MLTRCCIVKVRCKPLSLTLLDLYIVLNTANPCFACAQRATNTNQYITVWAMWTIPVIFLSLWLLMDCLFIDEKAFIFDHDYEVCTRYAVRVLRTARLTAQGVLCDA
jgi:hypothetical protein